MKILVACLALSFAPLASATTNKSPKQIVSEGSEQIRAVLREKTSKGSKAEENQKAKLKKVVDGVLDYRELARRSLGNHWKDRSEAEQKEFTDLLRDLIEAAYMGGIRDNIDYVLKIEQETLEDGTLTAVVATVASAKNSKGKTVSEDLIFHLFQRNAAWLIFDIEFGVDNSLVDHYRSEFNRKIRKESYAALVEAMRKKLTEVREGKADAKVSL